MAATDHNYLEAIRTGNTDGLRNIYREFLPGIRRLITRNGGSADDAMDIFQDALVILYEKCRSANGLTLTSSFYTLLYGICRNLWGNRLQKKSRSEVTLPDDLKLQDDTDLQRLIIREEENRIFWDAFRKLGKECQALLQLFFEQKKMEEIAETLSLSSVSYAKKRKFQCKEQLVNWVQHDPRYQDKPSQ
jgi:RNA polymerase sigma factor (sigma-70 family)